MRADTKIFSPANLRVAQDSPQYAAALSRRTMPCRLAAAARRRRAPASARRYAKLVDDRRALAPTLALTLTLCCAKLVDG